MSNGALSRQQVDDAGLDGWAFLVKYGLFGIETRIHTESFTSGRRLVNEIGEAAEELNHHADLDLRKSRIDIRLTSGYQAGGVTETDVRLARRIAELATAANAELECRSISRIELGLDTPDFQRIGPFWAAALGGELTTGEGFADVGDADQTLPLIWFQHSESAEPRQHWHLDVFVDPAQVQPRIDAALAAGGTLVKENAHILSDPDGNRVCFSGSQPSDAVASPDAATS